MSLLVCLTRFGLGVLDPNQRLATGSQAGHRGPRHSPRGGPGQGVRDREDCMSFDLCSGLTVTCKK